MTLPHLQLAGAGLLWMAETKLLILSSYSEVRIPLFIS